MTREDRLKYRGALALIVVRWLLGIPKQYSITIKVSGDGEEKGPNQVTVRQPTRGAGV